MITEMNDSVGPTPGQELVKSIVTLPEVDTTKDIAASIASKIEYKFLRDVLVKQLPVKKIMKEVSSVVPATVNEDGGLATASDVETGVQEVDSDFREGIVLSLPEDYGAGMEMMNKLEVGSKITYPSYAGRYFDLFKDTVLVRVYDVLAYSK